MDNPDGMNLIPPVLGLLLNDDILARNAFLDMEDSRKDYLLRNAEDFQSKEELERYLYHFEHDNFK